MSKETMVYIFSFDSKSGVFTLTSSKDQLTINSKHKKYEWLKGQEAGRIIKISDKGRWTSSNDYDNLYQIIKPIKKAEKKLTSSKNTNEKAGVYCFTLIENEFVLTDQNGDEIKITSKHKKFEWLQSQDSGRVIKISEKGRWNSSNDYDGLYDKIKLSKKKASQSVSKPTTQKLKSDNSDEIKKLMSDLSELKKVNNKLSEELSALKKKNDAEPFQFLVEITSDMLPEKDYDYIRIAFDDEEGKPPLHSYDWRDSRIKDEDWKYPTRHIILEKKPTRIVYWAHSVNRGWAERIEIIPKSNGLDIGSLRSLRKYYSDRNERTLNYQLSRVSEKEEEIKKLKNEIQLLKQKSQPAKPKATKKVEEPKKYEAKMTATYSYYDGLYKKKYKRTLNIEIVTGEMNKKPSQSFFKSYLKLATSKSFYTTSDKCGMNIYLVKGIPATYDSYRNKNIKLSDINFISIDEY